MSKRFIVSAAGDRGIVEQISAVQRRELGLIQIIDMGISVFVFVFPGLESDEISRLTLTIRSAIAALKPNMVYRRKTAMCQAVRDILESIEHLPEGDRQELDEQLALRAEAEWKRTAEDARLLARQKGIDQAAIDATVETVRGE